MLDTNRTETLQQRMLTVSGSNSAQLISCFTYLNSAALLLLKYQQIYLFGQIQTGNKGGQLQSHSYSFEVCILWLQIARKTGSRSDQ